MRSYWANRINLQAACSPPWLPSRFGWSSHWSLCPNHYSFRFCGSSSYPGGISVWPHIDSAQIQVATSWSHCSWSYLALGKWVLQVFSPSTRLWYWYSKDSLQVGSARPPVLRSEAPSQIYWVTLSLFLHIIIHTSNLHPQQFDILRKREEPRHISFQFVEHLFLGSQWQFIALHELVGE